MLSMDPGKSLVEMVAKKVTLDKNLVGIAARNKMPHIHCGCDGH